MSRTRRSLLRSGAGVLAASAIAGCLDGAAGGSEGVDSGYAAFFTLHEWSEAISGDLAGFEDPVDVGQMGHGWEPTGNITADIASTDAFVYIDSPEFAWAQDVATTLETDYDNVAVIDAFAGLEGEFIRGDHDDEHDDEHDDHDDEHEAGEDLHVGTFELRHAEDGEVIAEFHGDHWDGETPTVPHDGHLTVEVRARNDDGDEIHLGEDANHELHVKVEDESVLEADVQGETVEFHGHTDGETEVVFEIHHDGHAEWESPHLGTVVGEGHDGETHDDHEETHTEDDHDHEETHTEDDHDHEEDEGDHDHGPFDPHVWVDPVLAQAMVRNIADGLAAADPENEATYRENADAYVADLEALDESFRTLVEEADREAAVLAGHNSFQYLEARYGFELHTPVAISPKAQPSQSDVADTIEFVDDNGIDVVLYDRFESPNLAETIVENSNAEETRAISPAAGTTPEWNDEGWGYIDQMEQLNLPAFRDALGAE